MTDQLRQNIRNYLYPMTVEQIRYELELSTEQRRTDCIREYLGEVIAQERKEALIDVLNVEKLAELRDTLPADQVIDILLSEIDRARAIASGKPYYDYASQAWVEGAEDYSAK